MPVREWNVPDHLIAEWNIIDEKTGDTIFKSLSPEDVIPMMAEGYTVTELVSHYNCPREAVEHVIASIPEMMVWKEKIPAQSRAGGRRLPVVEVDNA